jgi:hypothetical protein
MHYVLNKTRFPLLPATSPGLAASFLARSIRFSLLIPISNPPHLSLNPLHSPMALYEPLPRALPSGVSPLRLSTSIYSGVNLLFNTCSSHSHNAYYRTALTTASYVRYAHLSPIPRSSSARVALPSGVPGVHLLAYLPIRRSSEVRVYSAVPRIISDSSHYNQWPAPPSNTGNRDRRTTI